MKQILSDFRRAHISMLVRYTVIVAICIVAFVITGIFSKPNTLLAGIVVTAFLCAILVWAYVDVLAAAPAKFRRRLAQLSDSEQNEVLSGYSSAGNLGNRRFYKKSGWLMFYSYRRIELIKYAEIQSAEPKGGNIFLKLSSGREVIMPVAPNENDAMLLAVLKQYQPEIILTVNGTPVSCAKAEGKGKDET